MLHGACTGEVYGLIEGAFEALRLVANLQHDTGDVDGTMDEGTVGLLYSTCAGEVDGLTEDAFDTQWQVAHSQITQ